MASVHIYVTNLKEIAANLKVAIEPAIEPICLRAGEQLATYLNKAPGKVRYPIQWKSLKQKRFYFALRYRTEKMRVAWGNAIRARQGLRRSLRMRSSNKFMPYRRRREIYSENQEGSWAANLAGNKKVVVGSVSSYAPWVQGEKTQQPFHRNTGWITDEKAMRKLYSSGALKRIAKEEIEKAVKRFRI